MLYNAHRTYYAVRVLLPVTKDKKYNDEIKSLNPEQFNVRIQI